MAPVLARATALAAPVLGQGPESLPELLLWLLAEWEWALGL
jgi:hypothetical protein